MNTELIPGKMRDNKRPIHIMKSIVAELAAIQRWREENWKERNVGQELPELLQEGRDSMYYLLTCSVEGTWSRTTRLPECYLKIEDVHNTRLRELNNIIKFLALEWGSSKDNNKEKLPAASSVSADAIVACSSQESAHGSNDIPNSNTLETGCKQIKRELGINDQDSVETDDQDSVETDDQDSVETDDQDSVETDEVHFIGEGTATPYYRWIKYKDDYPALMSKLIGNQIVSTSTRNKRSHFIDMLPATKSKSKWMKRLVEYPALMAKLIGNETEVDVSTSADNDGFPDSSDIKPIFPDEKIMLDSEGKAIIDLVNESDDELKNRHVKLDKTMQ